MKTVAIYCGSSPGNDPAFISQAQLTGKAIVDAGLSPVYGSHATGIMVQRLVDREKAHRGLSKLIAVEDMQQRKKMMASQADAFMKASHRQILIHDTQPNTLLQRLKNFDFPSGMIK